MPTSHDPEYNRRSWPEYAAAVASAGGEPIEIPLDGPVKHLRSLLDTCSAFVLPGSPADVEPGLYGQERDASTAEADPAAETCLRVLLELAGASGRPVLAICFGLQFLNVWRGGTLVQDLLPVPVNHDAGRQVAVAHSVMVAGESLLGGLLTGAEAPAEERFRRLPVNSSHHQAVASPGDDLAIVARSTEDGVIEALEGRIGGATMLGVQWHPERSFAMSPASRALFAWLISAAADWLEFAA